MVHIICGGRALRGDARGDMDCIHAQGQTPDGIHARRTAEIGFGRQRFLIQGGFQAESGSEAFLQDFLFAVLIFLA